MEQKKKSVCCSTTEMNEKRVFVPQQWTNKKTNAFVSQLRNEGRKRLYSFLKYRCFDIASVGGSFTIPVPFCPHSFLLRHYDCWTVSYLAFWCLEGGGGEMSSAPIPFSCAITTVGQSARGGGGGWAPPPFAPSPASMRLGDRPPLLSTHVTLYLPTTELHIGWHIPYIAGKYKISTSVKGEGGTLTRWLSPMTLALLRDLLFWNPVLNK